MNHSRLAVIGVGNMAKAIIAGILRAELSISDITLYDKNSEQYTAMPACGQYRYAENIQQAVTDADYILLSVKPQNYEEVLAQIGQVPRHEKKVYISIAAGIASDDVSRQLNGACVIRVLPNVPMLIGQGVSLVCETNRVRSEDFSFVCDMFQGAGSVLVIDEANMNRMIGVTSSSPAYVFRFIQAIYEGAVAQGLPQENLLDAICDVVIGSARMLKESHESPEQLIARVASKGGTTEQALNTLTQRGFDETLAAAMLACTQRSDALGNGKK